MWGYFSLHPFLFFIAISTTSRTSMVSSLDQCFQEISAFLASLSCWACCQILMGKFSLWTWCIRSRSPIEEYCKKRMFDLFIASLRTWHEPCMLSDVTLAMGILVHIVILGGKRLEFFFIYICKIFKNMVSCWPQIGIVPSLSWKRQTGVFELSGEAKSHPVC